MVDKSYGFVVLNRKRGQSSKEVSMGRRGVNKPAKAEVEPLPIVYLVPGPKTGSVFLR